MNDFNESISNSATKLKQFLSEAGRNILILSHVDADGLCSAEILKRFLTSQGFSFTHLYPLKGANAFTPSTTERVNAVSADSLIVLDLGAMDKEIAKGKPTLFIDHHRPFGYPEGAKVISSYGSDPAPPTSLITFNLIRHLTSKEDLGWLAATGAAGDLGSDFILENYFAGRIPKSQIREAEILLNSAKRSSHYDIDTPISLLEGASKPGDLTDTSSEAVRRLQTYRAEVNAEVRRCRREAPLFSWKVAIIPFESPCDIQGLIAETWRRQLKKYVVIAANFGFLKDKVAYVIRTQLDVSVIDFMESIKPPDVKEHIVFGHDRAAGAIIEKEIWAKLVDRLGLRKPFRER